jgi:hypothetical protein
MRAWMYAVVGCAVPWLAASWSDSVRADEIHLVGGTQLDGKATRHGDKVIVEMESVQIVLSADSVERIDHKESTVQHYEALESKLQPGDVQGRLSLADFCRAHDMAAREKTLLREVIELDPNQAQARARLGFVKGPSGWITHDEQMRAQGFVQRDGQWVSPERALDLDRMHAEADAAAKQREAAEAELDAKRAEVAARKQQLAEDEADRDSQPTAAPGYGYGYGYGFGVGYAPYRYAPSATRAFNHNGYTSPASNGRSFPIPGVRDPRSNSWPLNGVRNPRSY